MSKAGADGEHIHLRYIELVNAALKGKPPGMAVCSHSCRGNFLLEYDDERSGGFEPLRFVPKGKMVVLGLVTTKRAALESKDSLKRRIDQAAKYVPLEQLCLSPQCGFSSTIEGNDLTEAEQARKLRLVVETAREVWG